MRRWWSWRRELRQARRDEASAYAAWRLASAIYEDSAEVFRGTPGIWGPAGPLGAAQDEVFERFGEFRAARTRRARCAGISRPTTGWSS